ncbi:succinate semialdehyde dehydrogenase NADP+ linked [Amphichorda felina]
MAVRFNAPLRRFIAASPSPALATSTSPSLLSVRPFSLSPSLHKKRKVAAPSNSPSRKDSAPSNDDHRSSSSPPSSSSSSSGPQPDPEDPLNFSSLTAAWAPMDAHFKSQLHALLNGGRFNPESLGALAVSIKSSIPADDGTGASITSIDTFPLSELAQVVPRSGRTISLLVNDRDYIKPIMSAIQSSPDFNQQPQRSDDNDLELLLKIEMERKEDVIRRLKDAAQTWRERVRHSRTKYDKVLKDWKKNKVLTPDMARKAETELQKVQNKKMKEIDDEETKATRQLERNSV